jgi:hypothetical protein
MCRGCCQNESTEHMARAVAAATHISSEYPAYPPYTVLFVADVLKVQDQLRVSPGYSWMP